MFNNVSNDYRSMLYNLIIIKCLCSQNLNFRLNTIFTEPFNFLMCFFFLFRPFWSNQIFACRSGDIFTLNTVYCHTPFKCMHLMSMDKAWSLKVLLKSLLTNSRNIVNRVGYSKHICIRPIWTTNHGENCPSMFAAHSV